MLLVVEDLRLSVELDASHEWPRNLVTLWLADGEDFLDQGFVDGVALIPPDHEIGQSCDHGYKATKLNEEVCQSGPIEL